MNIRSSTTIRSPAGIDEECAVFSIDDTATPFVMHGIAQEGQQYTLSFHVCSDATGSITAGGSTMATGADWTRCVVIFTASDTDIPIYFGIAGTYYIYHAQLEIGCKDTDFTLAPEDMEDADKALDDTIKQQSAEINILKDSISLKVSTEVFTDYQATVSGQIDDAISISADDATAKANQALADAYAYADTIDAKLVNYSTTTEVQTAINLSKDSILSSVSETYSTKTELETAEGRVTELETWQAEASQKITKDGIIATVGNYYAYQSDLETAESRILSAETQIRQQADEIELRVTKDGVISAINQSAEEVKIQAAKITLEGATIADSFTATNLHITGDSTFDGTGSFSGQVKAESLYVDGVLIKVSDASTSFSGPVLDGSSIADTVNIMEYLGPDLDTATGGVIIFDTLNAVSMKGDLYGVNLFSCQEIWGNESHISEMIAKNITANSIKALTEIEVTGNITAKKLNTARVNVVENGLYFNTISGAGTYWNQAQLRLSGNTGTEGISLIGYLDGTQTCFWHKLADQNGNTEFSNNLTVGGTLAPKNDNSVTCGSSSYRWSKVYAASSTISTSDERDKDIIGQIDDRYKKLFMDIDTIMYRWKDTRVDNKVHLGCGAQSVENAAIACGITPTENGMIDHDYWDEPNEEGRTDRYGMAYAELAVLTVPIVQDHEHRLNDHDNLISTMQLQEESLQYQLANALERIGELEETVATQAAEIEQLRSQAA